MIAEPLNAFPAWDFFVTANQLIDWIWPSAGTVSKPELSKRSGIKSTFDSLDLRADHDGQRIR
jgi:hypothetical protein